MPRKLVDMKIMAVAGVDRAANQRKWLIVKQAKDDMEKQETKREEGEDFPAAAFAYVPDPESPSTWKLRLWDSLEEKETAAQVGRAVAALGPGFRGQRVDIPAEDRTGVIRRVRQAWRRVNPDADAEDMPEVLKREEEAFVNESWMQRVLASIAKKLGIDTSQEQSESVRKMGMPMTTSEVLAHDEAKSRMWELQYALGRSIESIMSDPTTANNSEMLMQSINEFTEQARALLPHLQMEMELEKAESLLSALAKVNQPVQALTLLKAVMENGTDRRNSVKKEEGDSMNLDDVLKGLSVDQRQVIETALAKSQAPAPQLPEEIVKALGKLVELEKQVATATQRAETAEAIAKAEREQNEQREYLQKGAKYSVMGAPEVVADILKQAYQVSQEYGKNMEQMFAKAQAENDKNNLLFKEMGNIGVSPAQEGAEGRINKMAEEYAAKHGVPFAKAYDAVLTANPNLYKEVLREGGN